MSVSARSKRKEQLFPATNEFENLIKEERWERLLWLPYEEMHITELQLLFAASYSARKKPLPDWFDSRKTFDEAGTKTLLDVINRFFDLVDIMLPALKTLKSEPAATEFVVDATRALHRLEHALILPQYAAELEAYRSILFVRVFDPNKQQAEKAQAYAVRIFSPCMCYTFEVRFVSQVYNDITSIYGKDRAARSRFLSMCSRELEDIIVKMENVRCQDRAFADAFFKNGFPAITSIVQASRLESAFPCSGFATMPIPAELSSEMGGWFNRMFAACTYYNILRSWQVIEAAFQSTISGLPEFWLSCEGKPFAILVDKMWIELSNGRHISSQNLLRMADTLRIVVYALQHDPSALNRAEAVLDKVNPLHPFLRRTSASDLAWYPGLAMFINKLLMRIIENRSWDEVRETFIVPLELFQNLHFIADSSPTGAELVRRIVTGTDYAALKSLEAWSRALLDECERLKVDLRVAQGGLQKDKLILLFTQRQFWLQMILNVLDHVLKTDEVRRQFLLGSKRKRVRLMIQIREYVRNTEGFILSEPRLRETVAKIPLFLDSRYPLNSIKHCTLSILNAVLLDAMPNTVILNNAILSALFDVTSQDDSEAALAMLALARIVENSPENWKTLQAFQMLGNGRRLSDLCGEACNPDLDFSSEGLLWRIQALALFQYMSEKDDDDGNNLYTGEMDDDHDSLVSEKKGWRPIEVCLMQLSRENMTADTLVRSPEQVRLIGSMFELLGNYAANAARANHILFAEDEAIDIESVQNSRIQVNTLVSIYLEQPISLRTTLACAFALANLTGVPGDDGFKKPLAPHVMCMVLLTTGFIRKCTEHDQDPGALLDDLVSLTSKAIINTSALQKDGDIAAMIICIQDMLKRALRRILAQQQRVSPAFGQNHDATSGAVYALLALHNLMRNSPERKAMVYELSLFELIAECVYASEWNFPLRDASVGVMKTFLSNNPQQNPEAALDMVASLNELPSLPSSLKEMVTTTYAEIRRGDC